MTAHGLLPTGQARRRPSVLIASVLGCGFSPVAPGTVGSLAALLTGALLVRSTTTLLVAILLACAAGFWAIGRASQGADHGWIVIDEVAGQWITLLGLPTLQSGSSWWQYGWLAAAFALFRLLDITKPGPIGVLDRRHGAFGVMADDILAGILGAALLRVAANLLS